MPTIIDSLIVTLNLDPSNFTKGQKDAATALLKFKEEGVKSGKEVEKSATGAEQMFGKLQSRVLALFAIFSAGRGVKDFFQDIQQGNLQVGRMANLWGMSTEKLSAFMGIARIRGGDANSVVQSIASLNGQLQQMALTGDSSILPYLRALGVDIQGANGQIKTAVELLPELAEKLAAIAKVDPARATAIGHGLGLSDDMIGILVQGRKALADYMEEQKRLGVVTEDNARKAAQLHSSWAKMTQAFDTLGRQIEDHTNPALASTYDWLTKLFVKAADAKLIDYEFDRLGQVVNIYKGWIRSAVGTTKELGAATTKVADEGSSAWKEKWGQFGVWWRGFWDNSSTAILNSSSSIMASLKKVFGDAFGWVTQRANAIWEKITGRKLFNDESDIVNAQQPGGSALVPNASQVALSSREKSAKFQRGVDRLMTKGRSREDAIAIMTQFDAESGLRNYAVGDNGQAYGMGQWHPDRQANFRKVFGKDIKDSTDEEQWDFADWELNNTERTAGLQMTKAKTSERKSYILSKMYEGPADAEGEANKRAMMARAWDQKLKEGDPLERGVNAGVPTVQPDYGAPTAAQWGAPASNDNSRSSSSTTHIDNVNISVPAGSDGKAIGAGFKDSVEQDSSSMHAEYGYN